MFNLLQLCVICALILFADVLSHGGDDDDDYDDDDHDEDHDHDGGGRDIELPRHHSKGFKHPLIPRFFQSATTFLILHNLIVQYTLRYEPMTNITTKYCLGLGSSCERFDSLYKCCQRSTLYGGV